MRNSIVSNFLAIKLDRLLFIMDEYGKTDGESPVFDDALVFAHGKVNHCLMSTVMKVIFRYYFNEALKEASDVLHVLVGSSCQYSSMTLADIGRLKALKGEKIDTEGFISSDNRVPTEMSKEKTRSGLFTPDVC